MLKNILKITFSGIFMTILCCCAGKGQRPEAYTTVEGSVWHTTMHVTYGSERNLADSITAIAAAVERSLSPFMPDSRISLINRGESAQTDAWIDEVFAESQRINRLSGGAFDPTVAPLVNLWGFGYADGAGEPTQEQVDSCLGMVGIGACSIDGGVMSKKSPGTQFNFSAITKGFGIDCIAAMMQREGIGNYMIEIGGEIALSGVNAKGEKWHIQIDAPVAGEVTHEKLSVIAVTDCCIATSGNYRNYRDTGRGRVGHTISPATGMPSISNVLSATVIAPTAMTADAFATAMMAMDETAAMAMIEAEPGVEAMLVVADGDGWRTVKSGGFPEAI